MAKRKKPVPVVEPHPVGQPTPGEWSHCKGSHKDSCICGLIWSDAAGGTVVASVNVEQCPVQDHGSSAPPTGQMKANMRLFSAAKELLAACKAVLGVVQPNVLPSPQMVAAQEMCASAVAKAEGRCDREAAGGG